MKLLLTEKSGPLPTSTFDLYEDDVVVGSIQIRHKASKSTVFPDGFENHIYYEIKPEYRGHGYGKEILRLGKEEVKNIGLSEIILTCKEENIPSQKIIESNGGLLVDKKPDQEGNIIRKYIIKI